ncbi:MAG: hypothetical protein NTX65_16385 [Ignavibacteriales bacterium]|nr:hypothetical protein [Ignavibacteriales bacterium]
MRLERIQNQFSFFTILPFLLFLNTCENIVPINKILTIYTSPKINAYTIHKVVLLPMAQDDTTNSGTFYSTNHFFNMLAENYANIEFVLPSIGDSVQCDTLIPNFIESIEKLKRLDLKNFFNSEIGSAVYEENPDAILIGRIDKSTSKTGFAMGNYANVISCEFRYYLISLGDGRVLWKAEALGEEGYYIFQSGDIYPPLDNAISNGIDKIINRLPFN